MDANTLADVLDLVSRALRQFAPTPISAATSQTVTVSQWAVTYSNQVSAQGLKAQTVSNRTSLLKHIVRIWGGTELSRLRPAAVSASLRSEFGGREATAHRVLAEFRAMLQEAVANDLLVTNPAAHVKITAPRVMRKRLTEQDYRLMLQESQKSHQLWLRPLLLLALITGQRRGDLAKMRFDDVVDGYLRVEQQKQAGKGYGARVALPLSLSLGASGCSLGDVIQLCTTVGSPGPTLLRKANGAALEESSLSIRFAECFQSACDTSSYHRRERPSLHEVRSLAARLYSDIGADAQTILGHKHADMTELYKDDRGLTAAEWKVPKPITPPG